MLLVVVATTTLVVIAFAIPLGALVHSVARDRAIAAAERDASALAPVLAVTDDAELLAAAVARTATGADGRLTVWVGDTVLGDRTVADPEALDLARERQAAFTLASGGGLELWSPVVTERAEVSVIRARIPAALLDEGVRTAWAGLAAVAVALVAAAVVVADRLARSLTADATALAATARLLAGGDPAARVVPGPTPELAQAGQALNLLADRIVELRTAERERVADLSHRLRTPLTALRLEAESSASPGVVAGVDRLEAAVTELVRAARRPLHDSPVPGRCDLVAVVRARADFWSALADDDGRPWSSSLPAGPVSVGIAADEVAATIDALVGNVFAHTPDGTAYAIDLAVDGDIATLTVHDGGPGVSSTDAVTRGVTGRGSTGLGLDIARRAAADGGGALVVGVGPLGGASVRLRLPTRGGAS